MQKFRTENNLKFAEELFDSYFGKEILLYTPLLNGIPKGLK